MSLSDVKTTYDIFLSYSSADRSVVQNVARRLREEGVNVWFDQDSLTPGANWQDELAARLMDSGACAVCVGPYDIAGWVRFEMQVALDRAADDHDFRVFPVLLPGIDHFDPSSMLHPFLATRQWVDLRAGPESAEAIQELINAMRGVAPQVAVTSDDGRECPYRGLVVFEEEHAPYFFGRTAQVQRLTESLRQGRFLAVIGQSGVGKSSLVRAGLLPRLRAESDRWHTLLLRPGVLPATTLMTKMVGLNAATRPTVEMYGTDQRMLNNTAVVALGDEPAGSKLLVVVDQFEELFTLCTNAAERKSFMDNLLYAATFPRGPVVVVVVLRADFYSRLVEHPAFAQLAQSHQVLVPPMGDGELREVILEPAYAVGLIVEQGLADTILDDVVREPGTLPLLELALMETWNHRRGNMLTLEGYRATGRVPDALGALAESVYGGLSDAGRADARAVFLRLIQPGEGTEDTRRRVDIGEITSSDDDPAAEVIRHFVDAFLLTTGRDEATGERWVEISHEAVITGWARCARWVDEDRAGLIVHRRLTLAAQEWKRLGRSIDALYRGTPLAEALEWWGRTPGRLNWLEGDFLDAGRGVERALRRARRWRYTAVLVALITALVVIAVVAVGAVEQRNIATSRLLAVEATRALDVDPALSITLALKAEDSATTPQADEVLRRATAESRGRTLIAGTSGTMYSVRLLPDGRHAVTGAASGSVDVWDLADGTRQQRLVQHSGRVYSVRVSPDGQTVASAGLDGTVRLTRLATGQSQVVSVGQTVLRMDFSHNGRLLAAGFADGTVRIVDLATVRETAVLKVGEGYVFGTSFNADDTLLATASADGTVQIWRVADRTRTQVITIGSPVYDVSFSPSEQEVAAGGADGKVYVWDASGAAPRVFGGRNGELDVVRFSHDGRHIAAAGLDGSITVWDDAGLVAAAMRGHAGRVQDVDFDAAGTTLVSVGADGTLRTWVTNEDVRLRTPVTTAAFTQDGSRIVSGAPDGRLRVWRASDLAPILDMADHEGRSQAVFSWDGSEIASYGVDKRINVRDATTGRILASFDPDVGIIRTVAPDPTSGRLAVGGDNGRFVVVDMRGTVLQAFTASGSPAYSAAFSPNGSTVAVGRLDGSVVVWEARGEPLTIKPPDNKSVYDVAFSPDGSLVASADSSGAIGVWSVRGERVADLVGLQGPASAVHFRADGRQVVSGGTDGTARVWDVATGEPLMTFPNIDGVVSSVDVDSAGRILKSAEGQQALRLLTCEVCGAREAVLDLAHSRNFRTLTPDEEQKFLGSG